MFKVTWGKIVSVFGPAHGQVHVVGCVHGRVHISGMRIGDSWCTTRIGTLLGCSWRTTRVGSWLRYLLFTAQLVVVQGLVATRVHMHMDASTVRSRFRDVKDVMRKQVWRQKTEKRGNAGLMVAWSYAQYAGETESERERNTETIFQKTLQSTLQSIYMCVCSMHTFIQVLTRTDRSTIVLQCS